MQDGRRSGLDMGGVVALSLMALVFGLNNVLIRLLNEAMQPVLSAGLRSVVAAACVWGWLVWRGRAPRIAPGTALAGVGIACLFAGEFLLLYLALDRTTVVRVGVFFYAMPFWLALGAHFLIPGERLTAQRAAGLAVAFAGVLLAFAERLGGAGGSLAGDLLALGAGMAWAAIVLTARVSALRRVAPDVQILWQLALSGPILLLAAPLYGGPMLRAPEPIDLLWFAILSVGIAGAGFIAWFRLLAVYPSWAVASFSFLTPVVSVLLGWLWLGETVSPLILAALGAVAAGIVLINRPQVPQKV